MNGFVYFRTIRLKKRRLAGHLDLRSSRTDWQFGVDPVQNSGVDSSVLAGEGGKSFFLDCDRICSRNQTGEPVCPVGVRHGLANYGVGHVRSFYGRSGNGGAGSVSHVALDTSGDGRLPVQHAHAQQGENCD